MKKSLWSVPSQGFFEQNNKKKWRLKTLASRQLAGAILVRLILFFHDEQPLNYLQNVFKLTQIPNFHSCTTLEFPLYACKAWAHEVSWFWRYRGDGWLGGLIDTR